MAWQPSTWPRISSTTAGRHQGPAAGAGRGTRDRSGFLREIGIAARSAASPHPPVARLGGRRRVTLYYVMPYVDGESLRDRPDPRAAAPVEDADRGSLAKWPTPRATRTPGRRPPRHQAGEHPAGLAATPWSADFGIARAVSAAGELAAHRDRHRGGDAGVHESRAGPRGGQCRRTERHLRLGTVLYEMLAGAPPFAGPTAQAIMARKATDTPPPIRTVRDSVTPELERTILKALARSPANRFATVSGLPRCTGATCSASLGSARNRTGVVAALVLVAAVGIAGYLLLADRGPLPPPVYTILTDVEGSAPEDPPGSARADPLGARRITGPAPPRSGIRSAPGSSPC